MSRSGLFQRIRERLEDIKSEMEKDGYDLVEQVAVLTLGGVLGGYAFQISQANYPFWLELPMFMFLLFAGLLILGVIHFFVSWQQLLSEE